MPNRVLVLATYPIINPQHGGQKRVAAIVNMYKEVAKSVKFIAVFHKKIYKFHGKDDISLGLENSLKAEKEPLSSDIICGNAIYDDSKVKKRLSNVLKTYKPDIIHIEQPFIYLGLRYLLKELNLKPKLVFGSQNNEGPMKREILENANIKESEIKRKVKVIEDIEKELSVDCDLMTACTEEDLAFHRSLGAQNTVLSRNGIDVINVDINDKKRWQELFKFNGIENKILFVASAHPPSITGFYDMIGKGLGFIKSDTKLLIAGSISDYFKEVIKPDNISIEDVTFWLRSMACGRLSEGSLGALLDSTDVIILPITEGGGSNLKTAEAVIANKKIVATTHAIRSFEWLNHFPNVWIEDDPAKFKENINIALGAPLIKRTKVQEEKASTVLWENQLKDLKEKVSKL